MLGSPILYLKGMRTIMFQLSGFYCKLFQLLPLGPKVVPFGGSCLEFYKVLPKRNYFGAYGS